MINYVRYYLYIIISFFIISCENKRLIETSKSKEYDSIRISDKYQISYRRQNNKYSFILFKENGQRKKYFAFYKSGNLKIVEDFQNDKITRIEDYLDTPENCLKSISNFLYNKRIGNGIALDRINFDSCGKVNLTNSVYVNLIGTRDTLTLNEVITLKLDAKYLKMNTGLKVLSKSRRFFEGGFDQEFNIVSKDSMKSFEAGGDDFTFKVKGTKLGCNYYRGVLVEKVIYEDGSSQINPLFVIYNFYVKKDSLLSPNNEKDFYLFFNKYF